MRRRVGVTPRPVGAMVAAMRRRVLFTLALGLVAPWAWGDPPLSTSATVGGVRVEGRAQSSSTDVPREPAYELHNEGAVARTVRLISLTSLGMGERARLPITSPRQVVLPPRARRIVDVRYRGRPLISGAGLPYHRYVLRVSVDGDTADVVATNAYMCRIPLRHAP